jgi:two-component system phosphate regulon sensor histidine kinase PhoR
MPYEVAPSPVIPQAGSRLWTAGAGAAIAIVALIGASAIEPGSAPWLLTAAAFVVIATWFLHRPRPATATPMGPDALLAESSLAGSTDVGLLDNVFEAMADPVLVIAGGEADDIAGRRVVLANAAARDLFRIQREGALLVSVLRDPTVLEAVDEALFGGVASLTDYAGVGAQTRHWRAHTRPLPSTDGHTLALVVLRDETDVRRMELMRVDFLANASHELKTPLASLSGFIETLKGHARDDPKARDKFLDIMAAQADRMSRLVADLLSLSRIELNEHIPPSGKVDLSRAAADVADAVSVLSADRAVSIVIDGKDVSAPVLGDRDEIVQVIQNLIDNAIKYSPTGGKVEVLIRPDVSADEASAAWAGGHREEGVTRLPLLTPDREPGQRFAAVSVRDHGPGMAREHLPRLTERFYRVEGQKSGERQGTGLGLAIVKHIVNRHRGGLAVESAPGLGAVFTAYFPVAPEKAFATAG